MALTSTVHRLRANVSDVDRGVYAEIDVRLARHPSETARFLLTRAIARCLCHDDDLVMGPGLCEADEPAMKIIRPDGRVDAWIEIGAPSAERLHRARKACSEVIVFCHHDPALVVKDVERHRVHEVASITLLAVPGALLDALEPTLDRTLTWDVTRTDGDLYLGVGGAVLEARIPRIPLGG